MRKLFARHPERRAPRTLVALWLRAGVLRQDDIRAAHKNALERTGWHDAGSVAHAAFDIVVKYSYTPPNRPQSIPDMVRGMRSFFGADGVDRVPQKEGETLIRAALDDRVSITQIPRNVAFMVHGLIFVGLALDLGLSEEELDAALVMAEDRANAQGFSPTLADY